jgi:hypothetical protein
VSRSGPPFVTAADAVRARDATAAAAGVLVALALRLRRVRVEVVLREVPATPWTRLRCAPIAAARVNVLPHSGHVFLLGLSLHRSPLVLVPTAVLALVFWLKSIREEAGLTERYPDYPAYRQATPRRFIPWII